MAIIEVCKQKDCVHNIDCNEKFRKDLANVVDEKVVNIAAKCGRFFYGVENEQK